MCAEARGRSVLPYSLSSPPARPACQQLGSSSPPAPGAAESLSSSAVRQQLARQLASSSPPVPAARQQLASSSLSSSLAAQQLTSSAKAPPPGPNSGPPPGPNSGHCVFACPGWWGKSYAQTHPHRHARTAAGLARPQTSSRAGLRASGDRHSNGWHAPPVRGDAQCPVVCGRCWSGKSSRARSGQR